MMRALVSARGSSGSMIRARARRPTHGSFFYTVVVDRSIDRSFVSFGRFGHRAGGCVGTRAWIARVRRRPRCASRAVVRGNDGAVVGSMELGSGVVDKKKRARGLARAIHRSVGCFYRGMGGGDA